MTAVSRPAPSPTSRSSARAAQLERQAEMAREGSLSRSNARSTVAGVESRTATARQAARTGVGRTAETVARQGANAGKLAGAVGRFARSGAGKALGAVGAVLGASAVADATLPANQREQAPQGSSGPTARPNNRPAPKAVDAPKSAPPAPRPERKASGESNTRREFNKAFAAARKEGKSEFIFRGKSYNTKLA